MKHLNRNLALTAAVLGGGAAIADLMPTANPMQLADEIASGRDHISAIDLGERMMRGGASLLIYDLRSRKAFEQFHIPGAKYTTVPELSHASIDRNATLVLYSEGGAHAGQAWVLLRMRGYRNVLFLREGVYEWISRVVEPRLAIDASETEKHEFVRASEISRYFGGTPLSGVARSEVPAGYWTGLSADEDPPAVNTQSKINSLRRRGC